jgi:hypothetical protein
MQLEHVLLDQAFQQLARMLITGLFAMFSKALRHCLDTARRPLQTVPSRTSPATRTRSCCSARSGYRVPPLPRPKRAAQAAQNKAHS